MYVSHAPDPMATNGEDTPVAPAPTPASPGYAVSSGSPYASVDVVDELSVDGMYRRYGQRRYSGEAPPRAPTLAEVVADPNNPEFDLERSMQATAEESRQQGWHSPPQTLTFQNLSVSVPQQDTHIPTYSTALVGVFKQPYTMIKEGSMFDKLVDINGYCRPGEMLLVMGPPGSGCSTLLKVLSGRRKNLKVGGQILYNGSPDYERLSLALIGEEDNHLPSLTVEQTLQFAMDMLMPREIPHRKNAKYVENVMRLLGLYRVKDTVVGDSMLRGVSGGEKKRVTIGEMLLGRARIFCYDGWSKGLDAAAALDICKITRVVANTLRNTVIMSQYQASGEMFDIFDNLLLLDGGRQVYFGPIKGAVQYFGLLGLRCPPRRTIPDFLATAVDRVAEVTIPGYTPPITKEGFADAFKESDAYRAVIQEIEATNRQPPPEGHLCAEAKAANERFYATPFKYQLKRLIARERLVLWQNAKTFIVPRISQMTMMGLILGLLFLKLGNTQKGAYSKTGALFQALTFIGFSSFSFMPALLLARGVFYKQKDAKFFRPMAWFLSKTLSDLPFTVLDVVLFGVIVYWMIGFYASVERFLFFELTLWLTNLTFSNLIRLFGCIGSDLSAAQALSAAFVLVFVFFSGFMIPMNKLPVVLKWLYWVSPLHYPLHALLLNEFMPLTLHCNPNEMTPSEEVLRKQGVNGSVAPYQICTIPGNPTGPRTGAGYLSASYGIDDAESFKWVDLLILAAFLFFFIGLAAIAVVKVDFGSQSSLMRYKRKRRDEEHEPSAEELDETQSQDFGTCKPAFVTWTSLSYQVPKPGKKRAEGDATITLLQEVFGYCNPRNMIALMGASGAGKTTLLDVLAMRKTGGKITGDIMVNGVRQDKSFKRYAGYVEQEDIHQPMTTVREALKFAARLRLPADAGEAKIEETVKSTMLLLGLTKIADALVGSAETGGGIPMEARKRLTIGVELVANPSILFMDEPTSGLDTRGALKVMKAARRIADSGRSVICTIHQPSAELFELFDSLLLLARGGRTVYFGPIGDNSSTLIQYFEHKGAHPCPENYNPADYILDVIGSGLTRKQGDKDWASIWNHSSQCKETVTHLQQRDFLPPDVTPFEAHSSMFPSVHQQFLALAGRTIRVFWRTPSYNFIRHVFAIAVGLLLGSSYFQLGDTQTDLQQYVSALFFAVFLGALGMMNAMVPIFTERAVFNREVANGSYRRHIYSGVYSLVELPFTVVSALLFVNIFFWMVGLPSGGDRYLFALLDFFVFQLFSVFMGQAIAAVAPSLQVALGVAPLLMSFWILHLGFLIPKSEIPAYFIEFNIVNPYKFFMRSFVASTLRDKPFRCTEGQYLEFPIPPKGCPTEPAATWSSTATHCRLCPQTSGDRFLDFYGWSASTRWTDLLILVACCVAFRVITTVAMTKRQYATR